MKPANLIPGIALMARLALGGTPQNTTALSLPVWAHAGNEAWPLRPEHLKLSCDGKPIPPNALRGADAPVSVGIVLQPTKYMLRHMADVQAALRVLLEQFRPGDELFTVNSLEQPALGVGFTSDPDAIVSSFSLPETKRRSHLYDGMNFALQYLEGARNSSRALLVIFDADDVWSGVPAKALKASILSAHIPTFVVSLYPRITDDLAPTLFEMTRLAIDSGGDIWQVVRSSSLPRVMSEVQIRPHYLLDLRPSEHCGSAQVHSLKLGWESGVAHRGVSLRYQRKLPEPEPRLRR